MTHREGPGWGPWGGKGGDAARRPEGTCSPVWSTRVGGGGDVAPAPHSAPHGTAVTRSRCVSRHSSLGLTPPAALCLLCTSDHLPSRGRRGLEDHTQPSPPQDSLKGQTGPGHPLGPGHTEQNPTFPKGTEKRSGRWLERGTCCGGGGSQAVRGPAGEGRAGRAVRSRWQRRGLT